ncbi:MAG: DUF3332 family protein [Cyclobacteriaceae bacterium]
MSRLKKGMAYLIIAGVVLTSCIGPFKLTNTLFAWNETMGSKWTNSIAFILFIPAYAITFVVDGFVLNVIEFWSQDKWRGMAEGEQKLITSADGDYEYLIVKTSDGFTITENTNQAEVTLNLVYKENTKTWFKSKQKALIPLVQLVEQPTGNLVRVYREDGTAVLLDAGMTDYTAIQSAIKEPAIAW